MTILSAIYTYMIMRLFSNFLKFFCRVCEWIFSRVHEYTRVFLAKKGSKQSAMCIRATWTFSPKTFTRRLLSMTYNTSHNLCIGKIRLYHASLTYKRGFLCVKTAVCRRSKRFLCCLNVDRSLCSNRVETWTRASLHSAVIRHTMKISEIFNCPTSSGMSERSNE